MISSFEEKQKASFEQFALDAATKVNETTPTSITDEIREFAKELSDEAITSVPVINDKYGLYGWCVDGVHEKIKHDGGSILFGWTIWEWPEIMQTAEFHSVWVTPTGELFDITPKPNKETSIVFVPDQTYPSDFDFDNRPRNRRQRIYYPPDLTSLVANKIAKMKETQREYEMRRAQKAGVTLEERIKEKLPPDLLPSLIDDLISACDNHEGLLDETGPAGFIVADEKLLDAMKLRHDAIVKLQREYSNRK